MKIILDTEASTLTTVDKGLERKLSLYSKEAFEIVSREWVRIGWAEQYYKTFSWFGVPVIQLPEDLVRLQEVVYRVQPDVIVETGIYQGGSLIFHASLFEALGKGRVIGIDIQIPEATRKIITQHRFASRITMLEGDSAAPAMLERVKPMIQDRDKVLVILDSNHTKEHVARELELYAPLVTRGSYLVATDGIMRDLSDVRGGQREWTNDNPLAAAKEFAIRHPEFKHAQPPWPFNESALTENVTYWPEAWLERIR